MRQVAVVMLSERASRTGEHGAGDEPVVALKTARWSYNHGKGGADPAFQWALEWARHLATNTPSDVEQFDEFLEYLVIVGFADEKETPR